MNIIILLQTILACCYEYYNVVINVINIVIRIVNIVIDVKLLL